MSNGSVISFALSRLSPSTRLDSTRFHSFKRTNFQDYDILGGRGGGRMREFPNSDGEKYIEGRRGMKVESRWKMWSMEILTISIKRWHPGNNVLSTERFTGKQRFHERFAANKLFSALDHAPPSSPSPRHYTVFYKLPSESSLRFCSSIATLVTLPPPPPFFIFHRRLLTIVFSSLFIHPSSSYFPSKVASAASH